MNILTVIQNTAPSFWLQVLLILSLTAIIGVVARRILHKARELKSIPEWVRTLCDSFYLPSAWMIWGYGILLTLESMVEQTNFLLSPQLIGQARDIFFLLFATWILLNWKTRYEKILKRKVKSRPTRVQDEVLIVAISKVLTVFIIVVTGLFFLDILEVQITALLAFGGMGGVAVGFAGKDVVANFFGGLMIHMNRHFSLDEWIYSPNKNFEGVVEDIGWYMTRIRTFERRPTYIPNALFIDAIIENPGRMYNRRIKQTVGVRYCDVKKIDPIVEDIRTLLQNHPAIDTTKTLLVHFVAFGPYSLDIEIYSFTKTTDWKTWRDIKQEIFLKIADIVETHGAEVAFPTSTIHTPDLQNGHGQKMDRMD